MLINKIKSIANHVFTNLKTGHTEKIYHTAFEIELRNNNIKYETEKIIPYYYKDTFGDVHTLGFGRIDLFIHNKDNPLVLELKATSNGIKNNEIIQLQKYLNYLKPKFPNANGLVINFPQPTSKTIPTDVNFHEIFKND